MNRIKNLKQEMSEFINEVVKPVVNNFIAVGSFIYLVVQLIAIFIGVKIIVPEEYRLQTIWVALILIISSFIYYWALSQIEKIKKKFRDAENRIKSQAKDIEEQLRNDSKKLQTQLEKLRNEVKGLNVKDPNYPIGENLTYDDIEFANYYLTKKIVESSFLDKDTSGKYDAKKNIIIGVDRGGAILGGMLAKNLGLATKTLAIFYANPPQPPHRVGKETSIYTGKCLDNVDFKTITKILLVDDVIRTGESMMAAYGMLKNIIQNNNNINIKIACILYQEELKTLVNPEIIFSVYNTNHLGIKLPWDKMHVYEKMLLEENRKEEFEKLCLKTR